MADIGLRPLELQIACRTCVRLIRSWIPRAKM
jgi:hypothetical protein